MECVELRKNLVFSSVIRGALLIWAYLLAIYGLIFFSLDFMLPHLQLQANIYYRFDYLLHFLRIINYFTYFFFRIFVFVSNFIYYAKNKFRFWKP